MGPEGSRPMCFKFTVSGACIISQGHREQKKVQTTCSNGSVPETLESFRVTSSLEVRTWSRSTDNTLEQKKSLSSEQNYNLILIVKWQIRITTLWKFIFIEEHEKNREHIYVCVADRSSSDSKFYI